MENHLLAAAQRLHLEEAHRLNFVVFFNVLGLFFDVSC